MDNKFAYIDETDKSYGIAGMVITLNIVEAEDALDYISLEQGEPSFALDRRYTLDNPSGATVARTWHNIVSRYKLMVNLVVNNILCRRCVLHRNSIDNAIVSDMRALIADEGRTFCSLDDDEISNIYRSAVREASNIFASPRVHDVARRYAEAIMKRRHLSHSEAFELLQSLL
ncbi:MAG: hypothetical protein ACI31E_04805 [Muribaculaceae bacterium]